MTSASSSSTHSDPAANSFQVDLRGLVDLLSHHLYSSPRVYVRELLQNAVDAVTARQALDPEAEIRIRLSASAGRVTIEDSGIGLTAAEAHSLLATIGRSSKRGGEHGLETTRREFLGQFGIGLLAASSWPARSASSPVPPATPRPRPSSGWPRTTARTPSANCPTTRAGSPAPP